MNFHPTSWPDAAVTISLLVIGCVLLHRVLGVIESIAKRPPRPTVMPPR